MIENFHFLRPWWLLALLLPLVILWLLSRAADVRSRWKDLIAPHLLDRLVVEGAGKTRIRPSHLLAVVLALAAIATAGPTWQRELPPFVEDTAPLVIAVDLSQTMDAIDLTPSRLERAKLKIRDVVGLRQGARTAIIAYAGSAHLVLPLTEDATLIETYADALATRIMPVPGKDTAKALAVARESLAQEEVAGTILLLTDGVEQSAFDDVERETRANHILVLGIGTAEGGPVKMPNGSFATGADGARLFAKLDIESLKNLHAMTGADVATMTIDDTDVRWIAERIRTNFAQKRAEEGNRWHDFGWWLTIPVAIIFVFTFRKGWVVRPASVFLLMHLAFGSDRAEAADWRFADMWLTPDQQGRLAFERADYESAAAHFRDPMWRGTALYRAGKFSDAIDAFAAVDTPESYYDQANALLHLMKFEEAIAAYKYALQMREDWPDAQFNLGVAEKLLAAQKSQEEEQQQEPNQSPDQIQFDQKGKQGKAGEIDVAEQTSELWMKNIQVSPADLMARKFSIEAGGENR